MLINSLLAYLILLADQPKGKSKDHGFRLTQVHQHEWRGNAYGRAEPRLFAVKNEACQVKDCANPKILTKTNLIEVQQKAYLCNHCFVKCCL